MGSFLNAVGVKAFTLSAVLFVSAAAVDAQDRGGIVMAWGDNALGNVSVPPGLSNVTAISAGVWFPMALLNDGTVTGWGYYYTPAPPSLSNVLSIAAGGLHCLALRSNGTVVAWGSNGSGESNVPTGLSNVVAIAASGDPAHIYGRSAALKRDGTITAWGAILAPVPPALTDTVAIAVGAYHALGLKRDSTVIAWGAADAQVAVPPDLSNVVAVAAGYAQSLALKEDGTVVAWGYTDPAPLGLSNVVAIAAGGFNGSHNAALKQDGTMVSWGAGGGPVDPPPGLSNIVAISCGNLFDLALVEDSPLVIVRQPASAKVYSGTTVAFSVGAVSLSPLNYQWRFEGTNLAGATGSLFVLTNVQPANAGMYSVALTNSQFGVVSSDANLTVNTSAPIISAQSPNQWASAGSNLALMVAATGSLPLYYQWSFNDTNILEAVGPILSLTNLQDANGGLYSVVVSNEFGTATSSVIRVTLTDLPSALNATELAWTTSTNLPWFAETNMTHDGLEAAQSASLSSTSQQSTLQTTVTGPGTLSFWCALNSYWGEEFLGFSIDDVQQFYLPIRSSGWQYEICYLADGNHTLEWSYYTPFYADSRDAAWLDQVSYLPGPTLPTISGPPTDQTALAGTNVGFSVTAFGTPPLSYQWQFNGTNLASATNTTLSLTNIQQADAGTFTVRVSNGYGSTNWSASLVVNPAAPAFVTQPLSQRQFLNGSVFLSARALGTEPVTYQWQFNGSNLDGAIGPILGLARAQFTNAGIYRVIASNSVGVTASSNAALTITPTLVLAWGADPFHSGTTNVPLSLSNVVSLAGGLKHVLALQNDGTVIAWGQNNYGQTNIPKGLSNVVAIAAGLYHNLALRTDGTVAAWGDRTLGQTNVPAGLSNVIAIACGQYHSLAVKSDGTMAGWGYNNYGQVVPPPGLDNVAAACGGRTHSLALKRDGTVVAWGWGDYGLTNVPSALSNVTAIAAGTYHSLGLKSNGTVVAWGADVSGVTNVPADLCNVVAIACGPTHSLALRGDGTVVSWGISSYGETNIPAGLTNVQAIACGDTYNLALLNDGSPLLTRRLPSQWVLSGMSAFLSVAPAGQPPLTCSWQVNGTNLNGATNSWLLLPAVRASDSGTYAITVSNAAGAPTSSSASLTVIDQPPFILTQPTNLAVPSSALALFQVVAGGSRPLGYQWRKDEVDLPQANAPTLALTNLRRTNSGFYTVVVSNAFGMVTSAEARLRVLVPQLLSGPALQADASLLVAASDSDGGLLSSTDLPFFQVWTSTNLVNWELLPTALTFTNGRLWLQDAPVTNYSQRFYRIGERMLWRIPVPQLLCAPLEQGDGSVQLSFGDDDGGRLTLSDLAKFQVWASTNLGNWVRLTNSLTISNGAVWMNDTAASGFPKRFYRVLENP